MALLTFEAFEQECSDRRIILAEEILYRGSRGNAAYPYRPAPSGMFAALIEASEQCRRNPYGDLSTDPIGHMETVVEDVAARGLIALLDACFYKRHPYRARTEMYRTLPVRESGAIFQEPTIETVGTCFEAEPYFFETVADMLNGRNVDAGRTVYHSDGRPILLQKATSGSKPRGAPSVLALVDIISDGLPYPAGSMCAVALSDEADYRLDIPRIGHTEIRPVEDIYSLSFRRLGAYSLDPSYRRMFQMGNNLSEEAKRASLMTIPEVAQRIAALYFGGSSHTTYAKTS